MNTVIFIPIFRKGHFNVTTEQIAVGLNDHENEIKSLKHRMDDVQEQQKTLLKLTTSVETLAVNMEYMAKEQTKQGERLERLEREPLEESKNNKRAIKNCIISGVGGAIISAILALIINGGI